jgi:hypothetical protein
MYINQSSMYTGRISVWGTDPWLSHCRRCEIPAKHYVRANEQAQASSESEARFVIPIVFADREPTLIHSCLSVEDPEHLHAIERDCVFFIHHSNVAKAEGLNQGLNDDLMRHGLVG